MGRNNTCVIYDSDENYAKRLMTVINDDNDIPYNAQVFTRENELVRYLEEKSADVLMICEDAYEYGVTKSGGKTVVLCEDEDDARQINSRNEDEVVGICKYQPSYQLLQTVMKCEKQGRAKNGIEARIIGVCGFNSTSRIVLSLGIAKLLSERHSVLFISFESYPCLKNILRGEESEDLSDALYIFRQNHSQFHKNITKAICHFDRLDYIPEAACAEDVEGIKTEELIVFLHSLGRELGYSYVIADIGDAIHNLWEILAGCDSVYVSQDKSYFNMCRTKNFEKYLLEQGMSNIVDSLKRIEIDVQPESISSNLWEQLAYTQFYEVLLQYFE